MMSGPMKITVNGDEVTLEDACTVADLLVRFSMHDKACAVELNRSLVTRRDHDERRIQEGDVVEIVTFVGGG